MGANLIGYEADSILMMRFMQNAIIIVNSQMGHFLKNGETFIWNSACRPSIYSNLICLFDSCHLFLL